MVSRSEYVFPIEKKAEATQKNVQNLTPTDISKKELTPAKIEHEKKLDQFITLLFHDELNMTDTCLKMGISRTTGYEWYHEWKRTQEPQKIDQSFWRLMRIVEADNPEKALDCATRVKIKMTDANVNVKSEVTEHVEGTVNVNTTIQLLREYEQAFSETETIETSIIPKDNSGKQVDTPEATS